MLKSLHGLNGKKGEALCGSGEIQYGFWRKMSYLKGSYYAFYIFQLPLVYFSCWLGVKKDLQSNKAQSHYKGSYFMYKNSFWTPSTGSNVILSFLTEM